MNRSKFKKGLNNFIGGSTEWFTEELGTFTTEYYKILKVNITKFKIKDGKVLNNVNNRMIKEDILRSIHSKYKDYNDLSVVASKQLVKVFDYQKELIESYGANPEDVSDLVQVDVMRQGTFEELMDNQQVCRRELKNVVNRMLTTDMSYKTGLDKLDGKLGKLQQWGGTLINTGMAMVQRRTTFATGKIVGAEGYIYTGSKDSVNRPFCGLLMRGYHPNSGEGIKGWSEIVRLGWGKAQSYIDKNYTKHDKVYTLEEIEGMDNGQRLKVIDSGGGYRCRHDWDIYQ